MKKTHLGLPCPKIFMCLIINVSTICNTNETFCSEENETNVLPNPAIPINETIYDDLNGTFFGDYNDTYNDYDSFNGTFNNDPNEILFFTTEMMPEIMPEVPVTSIPVTTTAPLTTTTTTSTTTTTTSTTTKTTTTTTSTTTNTTSTTIAATTTTAFMNDYDYNGTIYNDMTTMTLTTHDYNDTYNDYDFFNGTFYNDPNDPILTSNTVFLSRSPMSYLFGENIDKNAEMNLLEISFGALLVSHKSLKVKICLILILRHQRSFAWAASPLNSSRKIFK